jgi:hypothetical protein
MVKKKGNMNCARINTLKELIAQVNVVRVGLENLMISESKLPPSSIGPGPAPKKATPAPQPPLPAPDVILGKTYFKDLRQEVQSALKK